jgi:uncharacterized membrane protein YbaN (DUF454 family)
MIWNDHPFAGGVLVPGIADFQGRWPWPGQIMPALGASRAVPASAAKGEATLEEEASGLKIRCVPRDGLFEIVDPRMFRPGNETFCRALAEAAVGNGGAMAVVVDLAASSCRLRFKPGRSDEAELSRRVVRAIGTATEAVRRDGSRPDHASDARVPVEGESAGVVGDGLPIEVDLDRGRNLALGCGSLLAGLSGLVLPGIPSAPFLLVSAHYFMMSSTTFRGWLEGMPRVAEVIRKLESSSGWLPDRAMLLQTLGMAVLVGLLFLVIHPPLPLVLLIELGLTVFFSLHEIGELGPLTEWVADAFI